MTKIIEISSYPKCGNTWVRYILANIFNIDVHKGIPDIHQQGGETRSLIQTVELSETIGFYKSHILDSEVINPEVIIWIYRHPLDVFLSSMNYFYITENKSKFLDGIPRTVEELASNCGIDHYFFEFNKNLGADYYFPMLGELSNYGSYVDEAFSNPKVIPVEV